MQAAPCGLGRCNLCNICTRGFVLQGNVGDTARRTKIPLRYGEGIYFSSVSGKANDYAIGTTKVRMFSLTLLLKQKNRVHVA